MLNLTSNHQNPDIQDALTELNEELDATFTNPKKYDENAFFLTPTQKGLQIILIYDHGALTFSENIIYPSILDKVLKKNQNHTQLTQAIKEILNHLQIQTKNLILTTHTYETELEAYQTNFAISTEINQKPLNKYLDNQLVTPKQLPKNKPTNLPDYLKYCLQIKDSQTKLPNRFNQWLALNP